jgi:hypothetical protein
MNVHLINKPRFEVLLRDISAAAQGDVFAARGVLRASVTK